MQLAGATNEVPIITCAKLCRAAGGELEQIQLLLGHASVQTTERYLGTKQDLVTSLTWPSRRPSRCSAPLQRGLEATNKADERQTEYATDLPQLKQIEPAGPRFIVADESLRLPKFARHIHLA